MSEIIEDPLEIELESLEAIYINELTYSRTPEGRVEEIELLLHPATGHDTSKQYVCMTLVLSPPHQYPDVPPDIKIRNPRGLGEEEVASLVEDMKVKAAESTGEVMLYTLIEMAKDSLTEGNIPHCPCVVCLEHFHEADSFHRTACYHYFHCRCLRDYLHHWQAQKEEEEQEVLERRHLEQSKSEQKTVICPVCRTPLDEDSLAVVMTSEASTLQQQEEEKEEKFVPTAELKRQQQEMSALYERQKAKGGIIDLDAEKNKFLINEEDRLPLRGPGLTEQGLTDQDKQTRTEVDEEQKENRSQQMGRGRGRGVGADGSTNRPRQYDKTQSGRGRGRGHRGGGGGGRSYGQDGREHFQGDETFQRPGSGREDKARREGDRQLDSDCVNSSDDVDEKSGRSNTGGQRGRGSWRGRGQWGRSGQNRDGRGWYGERSEQRVSEEGRDGEQGGKTSTGERWGSERSYGARGGGGKMRDGRGRGRGRGDERQDRRTGRSSDSRHKDRDDGPATTEMEDCVSKNGRDKDFHDNRDSGRGHSSSGGTRGGDNPKRGLGVKAGGTPVSSVADQEEEGRTSRKMEGGGGCEDDYTDRRPHRRGGEGGESFEGNGHNETRQGADGRQSGHRRSQAGREEDRHSKGRPHWRERRDRQRERGADWRYERDVEEEAAGSRSENNYRHGKEERDGQKARDAAVRDEKDVQRDEGGSEEKSGCGPNDRKEEGRSVSHTERKSGRGAGDKSGQQQQQQRTYHHRDFHHRQHDDRPAGQRNRHNDGRRHDRRYDRQDDGRRYDREDDGRRRDQQDGRRRGYDRRPESRRDHDRHNESREESHTLESRETESERGGSNKGSRAGCDDSTVTAKAQDEDEADLRNFQQVDGGGGRWHGHSRNTWSSHALDTDCETRSDERWTCSDIISCQYTDVSQACASVQNCDDLSKYYVGFQEKEDEENWDEEIDPYAYERGMVRPELRPMYDSWKAPDYKLYKKKVEDRVARSNAVTDEERRMRREALERQRKAEEEKEANSVAKPVKSVLEMFKEKQLREKNKEKFEHEGQSQERSVGEESKQRDRQSGVREGAHHAREGLTTGGVSQQGSAHSALCEGKEDWSAQSPYPPPVNQGKLSTCTQPQSGDITWVGGRKERGEEEMASGGGDKVVVADCPGEDWAQVACEEAWHRRRELGGRKAGGTTGGVDRKYFPLHSSDEGSGWGRLSSVETEDAESNQRQGCRSQGPMSAPGDRTTDIRRQCEGDSIDSVSSAIYNSRTDHGVVNVQEDQTQPMSTTHTEDSKLPTPVPKDFIKKFKKMPPLKFSKKSKEIQSATVSQLSSPATDTDTNNPQTATPPFSSTSSSSNVNVQTVSAGSQHPHLPQLRDNPGYSCEDMQSLLSLQNSQLSPQVLNPASGDLTSFLASQYLLTSDLLLSSYMTLNPVSVAPPGFTTYVENSDWTAVSVTNTPTSQCNLSTMTAATPQGRAKVENTPAHG